MVGMLIDFQFPKPELMQPLSVWNLGGYAGKLPHSSGWNALHQLPAQAVQLYPPYLPLDKILSNIDPLEGCIAAHIILDSESGPLQLIPFGASSEFSFTKAKPYYPVKSLKGTFRCASQYSVPKASSLNLRTQE